MTAHRLLIVGFGNPLAGDDGAGPAVLERLRLLGTPADVRLEEGGCDGLLLGTLWAGEPEIWLVDALLGGKPPGTVSRLSHQELLALPQRHGSGHQLSLSECLRCLVLAEPSFEEVRLTLFGIEPLACDFPAPLSPLVAAAAEALAAALRAELEAPG